MPLIDIKLDEQVPLALQAMLGPAFLDAVLDNVAAAARAEWVRLAQTELHSSRQEYVRGIQEVAVEAGGARVIALVGWLPNAVEEGMSAFDMRETLLGTGAKVSKDGHRYRAIPFRHSGPGTVGAVGTPMGASYGPAGEGSRRVAGGMAPEGARALGEAVYAAVKRLARRRERLPAGMAPLLRPADPTNEDPRLRRGHATDIYSGMVKTTKQYAVARQSTYSTFRMISDNVTDGWVHPGIEPHNFAARVEPHIARLVPALVDATLRAATRRTA